MATGKKTGGRKKGVPNRATSRMREELARSGLTPLEHMLALLRDPDAADSRRDWAAEKAAPYCHPRLSSTEWSGPEKGPIELKDVSDSDRAAALLAFLAKTRKNNFG
jgi:hypothetical protein